MAAACARPPGGEVGGAGAKVPAAAPAHSSHLAQPFPAAPAPAPRSGPPVHLLGGDIPRHPPPRAGPQQRRRRRQLPSAAAPAPRRPNLSRRSQGGASPGRPHGPLALTPAERAARAVTRDPARHQLRRSSRSSAAPRVGARTRGGRGEEGGAEVVGGRARRGDVSRPPRRFRRRQGWGGRRREAGCRVFGSLVTAKVGVCSAEHPCPLHSGVQKCSVTLAQRGGVTGISVPITSKTLFLAYQ